MKSRTRNGSLKGRLRPISIRLTAKDQKRLAVAQADHIADKIQGSVLAITKLQSKLYRELKLVEDLLRMTAPFSVKSDPK